MQREPSILTPEERDLILARLDECLAVFESRPGLLTAQEIRIKSLLTTARHQLDQANRGARDDFIRGR